MTRSSIFSLFLTVIVVVMVAEALTNNYGRGDMRAAVSGAVSGAVDHLEAHVLADEEPVSNPFVTPSESGEIVETEPSSASVLAGSAPGPTTVASVQEADPAHITFGLVQLAGFENVTLQRVPFNGVLFERVDLRDFKSVPVLQQNLLHDNREKMAEFYEFHADSSLLAGEIYLLIQEKAQGIMGGSVNETNELGEKSFYINYGDRPGSAFLVVKTGETVYALTYEKQTHAFIQQLLALLTS